MNAAHFDFNDAAAALAQGVGLFQYRPMTNLIGGGLQLLPAYIILDTGLPLIKIRIHRNRYETKL